jgi:hypothetical protein
MAAVSSAALGGELCPRLATRRRSLAWPWARPCCCARTPSLAGASTARSTRSRRWATLPPRIYRIRIALPEDTPMHVGMSAKALGGARRSLSNVQKLVPNVQSAPPGVAAVPGKAAPPVLAATTAEASDCSGLPSCLV